MGQVWLTDLGRSESFVFFVLRGIEAVREEKNRKAKSNAAEKEAQRSPVKEFGAFPHPFQIPCGKLT